jgi:hypothetical protein
LPRIPEALAVAPLARPSGGAESTPAARPTETEIKIEIGRIDIREAARQPGAPQRSHRPRPLPALSDYLRGGRS